MGIGALTDELCNGLKGYCAQLSEVAVPWQDGAIRYCPCPVPAPPACAPAPLQGWSRGRGHKLDLPQPPPARPGSPSLELALFDVQGGGSQINPHKACAGTAPLLSPSGQAEVKVVVSLPGCCGSRKGCWKVQQHSDPRTESLLRPKGWATEGSPLPWEIVMLSAAHSSLPRHDLNTLLLAS